MQAKGAKNTEGLSKPKKNHNRRGLGGIINDERVLLVNQFPREDTES
jgi:hypothetical protein